MSTSRSSTGPKPEVEERKVRVLRGIIDSYIDSNEPVGSRTLSKTLDLGLSPASIRNIMSDLTESGYLMQSHTSGGRIPTDKAYRYYVDSMASANQLSETIQSQIAKATTNDASRMEKLLVNTTRVLADLTKVVCMVTTPRADVSVLQRIEFMKISQHKILVILITKSGIIRNKVIESSEDLKQDFLNTVSSYLNEQFHDASMVEIRARIMQSLLEEKERYEDLFAQAVRLGKKAFEVDDPPEFFMEGRLNMLNDVRFHDIDQVKQLLMAFEERSMVMEILDNTLEADGVQIYIGVENSISELKDCALVTAGYGADNHLLGMVGVIGPTSMDYQRIIPVVDYTAKIISQSLSDYQQSEWL